ncbi:MAG: NADH:ubiquinone oxidoreductase subunit 4 (chain M), partial [Micrococcales bacterium]|nr:NADH:ubiquinone oxidoreductase subunit 4 (chain M) [Micrococcales bacterium]
YVLQTDDPQQWTLVVNLAYASDEDLLLSTLIHEYAHILSLSPGQTDPEAWSCDTLQLDEGCAEPDSALWAFDQEFWAQYGTDAPDPANADADLAYEFYLDHEEDFVSDYAATNVVEDFAESFMTFVLEPEPDSDTTIAQKLLFFWDRPEYVEIRDHVRSEFDL